MRLHAARVHIYLTLPLPASNACGAHAPSLCSTGRALVDSAALRLAADGSRVRGEVSDDIAGGQVRLLDLGFDFGGHSPRRNIV